MEQHIVQEISMKNNDLSITEGKYYNKIHQKHLLSYGEYGAANIRDNIIASFQAALKQISNPNVSNNILLVGKVQSGKTSNLELFTALAFDNGFNLVIIYGGYDNTLLNQTTTRLKKTFDITDDSNYFDDSPVVFSSDDSAQLLTVDDEIIEELLDAHKPIFLISMKRPSAMNKVNNLLSRIDKTNLKAFIIDDEGDQASLNTKKHKAIDTSATYKAIVDMKNHLNDPLYLSVTATPQALIFLDEYSRLRPDSIRLIEPGIGYCGADAYHLYGSDAVEIIADEDQQDLCDGVLANSLSLAIKHYIIASAIMYKRKRVTSEMIIHSHRNVSDHDTIYRMVEAHIQEFKHQVAYEDIEGLCVTKKEYQKAYKYLFNDSIQITNNFDELWDLICQNIIPKVYIILKNSAGQVTQATENFRKYKIYIGGDLLQRGVTFPSLVTTYFTRWAKDGGNMDTNLQRARWFGYREKWIDICKIFTSENISREFTNLSEIETDLWEQFNAIQSGEMQIDDILIRADNTKQKPTRKNVASYTTVSFRNKWIKQRIGIFNQDQVKANNILVNALLSQNTLLNTTVGRKDNTPSAQYAIIDKCALSGLINHIQAVFDLEPFERKPLQDLVQSSGSIPVILMNDIDGMGRKRSFYPNNKIFALQQGADNKDKSKAVFLGDSQVVIDKNQVNIQIHKVVPKKKDANGVESILSDFTQYMFAIYIPKDKKYYIKG